MAFDAKASQVQEALERVFPSRALRVEEGAGDTAEFHSWKIVFPGQAVEPLFANGVFAQFFGNGEALSGGKEEANVAELSKGQQTGDELVVNVLNVGDAVANLEAGSGGMPLQIAEALPAGLRALSIEGNLGIRGPRPCEITTLSCSFSEHTLPPFIEVAEVKIEVAVEAGAVSGGEGVVSVSGGEGPSVRASHPIKIAKTPGEATPFGIEDYEMGSEVSGGVVDTQAGSHPFQATFTLDVNEEVEKGEGTPAQLATSVQQAKNLTFKLPPGFIGDPTAYPQCPLAQFTTEVEHANECPAGSVIGAAYVELRKTVGAGGFTQAVVPVFNLEPSEGEPARFGFAPAGVPVFIGTSVRTGEDYGVTAHVENIPQDVGFLTNTVTLWGVPGDARHGDARGYGCLERLEVQDGVKEVQLNPCEEGAGVDAPFLSLPTSCSGPLVSVVEGDSWQQAGERKAKGLREQLQVLAEDRTPGMAGCGSLQFGSEIGVSTDVEAASTPSGLKVDVHVPQEEALNPEGLAPAEVKNISVTLPEGLALNPAASDGLQACTQEQVGLGNGREAGCPDASKIATATIKTPLLPQGENLHGFVYLASPQNFASPPGLLVNPFGSLVAMYLVAKDPVSGVLVKLAGQVSLSESGQISTVFADNPQLPFEDAEVAFFGGERAPLVTPVRCGAYTTNASFEPWSNDETNHKRLHSSAIFNITTGPHGTPCPGPALPFTPTLASESMNTNAGGFSPLATSLSRGDGEQAVSSVAVRFPPGLSGLLTGVTLCGEAQANAGSCPEGSLIGETIVSVGVGGDPFTVTGGKVYLTGPYRGAPFGLSIVNPAQAGPFVLQEGRPVVVRAKIEVDPHTTALSVTTDPPGSPHAIPTVIEGIPLQIQHVNVTINRPGFSFNPTSCQPMEIEGQIQSAEGATQPVQVPFQVANCAVLGFAPKLSVRTAGKTSKAGGASLSVRLAYPSAPFGSQANIHRVKVELPKQLPSRLTTLQKACLAATFESNPASCPAASIVGHAKVQTPLLPVPLEGPAYFVSHGGAAFPDLTLVLQGYGVTVDLVGSTFISKAGVTSSTFQSAPDAPFSVFELTLPQGPDSALAANANLCKTKLAMPTEFIAQNGQAIYQSTPITPTGCPKPTKPHKHKKTHKKTAHKACHNHACPTHHQRRSRPSSRVKSPSRSSACCGSYAAITSSVSTVAGAAGSSRS